jgi:hypothetical protein
MKQPGPDNGSSKHSSTYCWGAVGVSLIDCQALANGTRWFKTKRRAEVYAAITFTIWLVGKVNK